LPSDLAVAEYSSESAPGAQEETQAEQDGSSAILDDIAGKLAASARPLVLIGLGATPGCAAAILQLVNKLEAPFLLTPKAKGIVNDAHPLFVGIASGMAVDKEIVETIRSADLVLAIGFDPVECDKTWFSEIAMVALDSASMREGDYQPLEAAGNLEQL